MVPTVLSRSFVGAQRCSAKHQSAISTGRAVQKDSSLAAIHLSASHSAQRTNASVQITSFVHMKQSVLLIVEAFFSSMSQSNCHGGSRGHRSQLGMHASVQER